MFSLINFRKKPFVGLDVNQDGIYLIALKNSSKGKCVEAAGMLELPLGAIVDGRIKNFDTIQDKLGELVKQLNLRSCPTAIALPHQHVMNKQINFSISLSEEEYDKEIQTHLTHYLGGITQPVSYDFYPIGEEGRDIGLIAARRDLIDEYVNLVNQSHLKVCIVDIDTRALARAAAVFHPSSMLAVLCIQTLSAQFFVFHNQNLIFNHRISLVDGKFIHELKLTLQMYSLTYSQNIFDSLLLCGKKLSPDLLKQIKEDCALKIIDTNFFGQFIFSQSFETEVFADIAPSLLVSLGLSLRSDRS